MACSSSLSSLKPPIFIKLLLLLATIRGGAGQSYTSVFSFGDSLADTGNIFFINQSYHSLFPPYGETYFHHPTGRCSDGRLVIDFIAESLGLPLVQPYLGIKNITSNSSSIQEGLNFAVVGATALDVAFFQERGINNVATNYSLRVQLDWFKEILPSLCNTSSKSNDMFERSLFLMGEIGGNDYNYPFFLLRTLEEIRTFVPLVIKAISSAIKELIDLGAVTLVVPGNLPIGCSAAYLTYYETADKEEYEPSTGCLKWLNKFAEYHNEELQKELGFTGGTETACCGGGGPYNYNTSVECGDNLLVRACDDPSQYVSWDGIHLTEAAYRLISNAILQETYIHHSSS